MVGAEARGRQLPLLATDKLEHKAITLDRTTLRHEGAGGFSGYASVWDNIDSYGDIVCKGAYVDTLPDFVKEGFIAFQHGWQSEPIAYVTAAKEDNFGLWIDCEFHSTDLAQNIRKIVNERLAAGKSVGLSIGYTVDHADMRKDGIRLLNKLTLFEVSLVNMPANRLAVVTDSKNADGPLVAQRPALVIPGRRKAINWDALFSGDEADDNASDIGNPTQDDSDSQVDESNDPEDAGFMLDQIEPDQVYQLDDKSLRLLASMGAIKAGAADGHWVTLNGGHILVGGDNPDVGTRFNVGVTDDDVQKLSVGDDAHTVFKMSPELQTRLKALHAERVQLSVGRGGWKDASGTLAEENALALHFTAPASEHNQIVNTMHDQGYDWHQQAVLVQHYVPAGSKNAELQAVVDLGRTFTPEEMHDLAGGLKQHFSGWSFTQENGANGNTRLVISNIKAWGGVPDKMFKQQVDTFAHYMARSGESPRARYRSVLNDPIDSSQPRSGEGSDVHGDTTRGRSNGHGSGSAAGATVGSTTGSAVGTVGGRGARGGAGGDRSGPGGADQAGAATGRGRPTSGPARHGPAGGVHGDVPGQRGANATRGKAEETPEHETTEHEASESREHRAEAMNVKDKDGGEDTLIAYWRERMGGGAGREGDFDDCVDALKKHDEIDDPEALCAWLHKQATGSTPGHAPAEDDDNKKARDEQAIERAMALGLWAAYKAELDADLTPEQRSQTHLDAKDAKLGDRGDDGKSFDHLPDAAFSYIEYGTTKSAQDDKSYPLDKRKYAHHDADGNVQTSLLREAISGVEREPLAPAAKSVIMEHLREHVREIGLEILDKPSERQAKQPFSQHIDQTLEAVDTLGKRVKARIALQAKDGRQLSQTNRARLGKIADSLHEHASSLQDVLTDNDVRLTEGHRLQGTLHNNRTPDAQDDLQSSVAKNGLHAMQHKQRDPRAAAARSLVKQARGLQVAALGMQLGPEAQDIAELGRRAEDLLPTAVALDAALTGHVADFAVNPPTNDADTTALTAQPLNVMRVIHDLRQMNTVATKAAGADALCPYHQKRTGPDAGRIEMMVSLVGAIAGLMDKVQSQLATWANALDPDYEPTDDDDLDDSESDESDYDDETGLPEGSELKTPKQASEDEAEHKTSGEALSRVEIELLEQAVRLAGTGLGRYDHAPPPRLGVTP